jgi:hypothetical protein
LEDIRGLLGTFLSDELTSIFLQTEKTPSPTKKFIIKTPNSIDSWPRKKKWTKIKYGSNTKKHLFRLD